MIHCPSKGLLSSWTTYCGGCPEIWVSLEVAMLEFGMRMFGGLLYH
jgi:hypothetical protein